MTADQRDERAYYQRVMDSVLDEIRAGRLKPGDPVPSSRKLAETYEVSDPTAQRALRELRLLGYTYGKPGVGTFVDSDAPQLLGLVPRSDDPDHDSALDDFDKKLNDLMWKRSFASRDGDDARYRRADKAIDRLLERNPGMLKELVIRNKLREIDFQQSRRRPRKSATDHEPGIGA